MNAILTTAVANFVERSGLSPDALGDRKRYEGYLDESRAILAFCDAARTEYGFTWQAIGKAVNRHHSTLIQNMKKNPDGAHIDIYYDMASDCIKKVIENL